MADAGGSSPDGDTSLNGPRFAQYAFDGLTRWVSKVGLFRATGSTTTTLQWDSFKCGKDNNVDDDADDTGTDYVFADYSFGGVASVLACSWVTRATVAVRAMSRLPGFNLWSPVIRRA
jgi:hypothetical protein